MSKKSKNPYARFTRKELILRDHLAIDRTVMANERSFLAYVRTAITIFLAGISLVKLFDAEIFHIIGWVLMVVAVVTIGFGYSRSRKMKLLIQEIDNLNKAQESVLDEDNEEIEE